jgi:UDP-N-acetylglucosamine--N-acetylmuramyl-(pentapeptide) pyrophosphoryl-undecaprenol N-acetylglucosamine transferase
MDSSPPKPLIAIACGGTGGHLFPGLAIAGELTERGCDILLLISPKEVDQQAVRSIRGMRVEVLPAIGLKRDALAEFCSGFWKSFLTAKKLFQEHPPQAVLAMGGFTCAPPVLAGKACGAATFLHESNTIPGKANRWLSYLVDQAFVGFPSAGNRLHSQSVVSTGTPVRPQFRPMDPTVCRTALGLDLQHPVLLVMGGSQGASAINDLVLQAVARLLAATPDLQFLHLSGSTDFERVQSFYLARNCKAVVRPFLTEMEMALGAATVAVSRAGASSLAELAAMRLPAILVPYPSAADRHQFYNARALVDAGAAVLLEQDVATEEKLSSLVLKLLPETETYSAMREELVRWHSPHAAEQIAEKMLIILRASGNWRWEDTHSGSSSPSGPSVREENPQTAAA